jgi:hypothetical protein
MPEEPDNSSGKSPEEKQSTTPRPTVIGSKDAVPSRKPTLIGGTPQVVSPTDFQKAEPTVIKTTEEVQPSRKPTVMGSTPLTASPADNHTPVTPTVIKPPQEAKLPRIPTVIGGPSKPVPQNNNLPKVAPTVISAPAEKPKSLAPTRILSGTPGPATTAQSAPLASTVKLPTLTVLPGVVRKRLDVKLSDVEKFQPATDPPILHEAHQLILTTNVDELTDRSVVFWGHNLQKRYSDLISSSLKLSKLEVLTKVSGYMGRMVEIFQSIDLEAVFVNHRESGFSRLFSRATGKADSPEELQRAEDEIQQLHDLMEQKFDELLKLRDDLERVSGEIDKLAGSIEASALAAAFLSDYLDKSGQKQGLSHRLMERGASLTQSLAQIRSSSSIRSSQIEHPLNLITSVQNVVLVTVPAWLGSVAGLRMMSQQRSQSPTRTSVDEVKQELRTIIRNLGGR